MSLSFIVLHLAQGCNNIIGDIYEYCVVKPFHSLIPSFIVQDVWGESEGGVPQSAGQAEGAEEPHDQVNTRLYHTITC